MTMMMAARKSVKVFLQNFSRTGNAIFPADATAFARINSTGIVETAPTSGTYTTSFTWLLKGLNSDYEMRMTPTSGTFTFGTTGSWLALSTQRTYTKENTGGAGSTQTVIATLEIRLASTTQVLASCTVTLNATVDI